VVWGVKVVSLLLFLYLHATDLKASREIQIAAEEKLKGTRKTRRREEIKTNQSWAADMERLWDSKHFPGEANPQRRITPDHHHPEGKQTVSGVV